MNGNCSSALFPTCVIRNPFAERSFPTVVIGNPSVSSHCEDGSPPTPCGDDRSESSFPHAFGGNPGCLFSDGSSLTPGGDDEREK